MKNVVFILCLVLLAAPLVSQETEEAPRKVVKYQPAGFYPTEQLDTVRVVLLVQDATTHIIALDAAAVRRKYEFRGQGERDPQWQIESYMMLNGNAIPNSIVWSHKLVTKPAPEQTEEPEDETSE